MMGFEGCIMFTKAGQRYKKVGLNQTITLNRREKKDQLKRSELGQKQ